MRPLDGAPRLNLRVTPFVLLGRMPADRGRVEEHLRAEQRRDPRRFRIPLVPADQYADRGVAGLPDLEAVRFAGSLAVIVEVAVSGGEVVLLVEERIVR